MRDRRWWRKRRLLVAVLCVDALALAVLGYVLFAPTGNGGSDVTAASATVRPAQPVTDRRSTTTARTTRVSTRSHRAAASHVRAAPPAHAAPVKPSSASVFTPNAAASFARLSAQLGLSGQLTVVAQPLGTGSAQVLGRNPAMVAMSTSKVLILSALLKARNGHLTASETAEARTAITESDNGSILSLFADLERIHGGLNGASGYATSLLRQAGDPSTSVTTAPPPAGYVTTFGQTAWSASREVTFFRALAKGCVIAASESNYVLGLMSQIESSESWGLGSAGFSPVAFKGGWGPLGGGYGVRQTGIVGSGSARVAVAITIDPAPSFGEGTTQITTVAHWLKSHLRIVGRPAAACPAPAG